MAWSQGPKPILTAISMLPVCPHLPPPDDLMTAEVLSRHGKCRGAAFYVSALTYGHYLWQRGLVGRAILKLDRAFGADLLGDEPELRAWPLPYAALAWFLHHAPDTAWNGNPRIHFQHLAGRMNGPRREQRRWRAWACWYLTRRILPELPGDSKHQVVEPSLEMIGRMLALYGIPDEPHWWEQALVAGVPRVG